MKIRNGLIVGVAALVSAQTVAAAPPPASLDPLVAVSAFGTVQSKAAVAPAISLPLATSTGAGSPVSSD